MVCKHVPSALQTLGEGIAVNLTTWMRENLINNISYRCGLVLDYSTTMLCLSSHVILITCSPRHLAYAAIRGFQEALHTFQHANVLIIKDHSNGKCRSLAI